MPRLRVQLGGKIGPIASWSNTAEFILSAQVASQTALQAIVDATKTTLSTSAGLKGGLCTDTTVTSIKMLHYPNTTGLANLVAESAGSPIGGIQAPVHAPQVAVVASLRTGNAGRSQRGRMYVPYRASGVSPLGVVNSATQALIAAYANAIGTAVVAACATQAVAASWVVWSPTKATSAPVSAVLVGSQCDTIRHRNDAGDEIYASFPVLAAQVEAGDAQSEEYLDAIKNGTIKFDGPHGESFVQALIDVIQVPIP